MRPVLNLYPRTASWPLWLPAVICGIFSSGSLFAQRSHKDTTQFQDEHNNFYTLPVRYSSSVSVSDKYDTILWIYKGFCKATGAGWLVIPPSSNYALETAKPARADSKGTPLIRVQGNVEYSFLYRSFVDTPFSQNHFQQHTVQTYLNITIKDKYPISLRLSKRVSNSPYFRDLLDVNMQFDQRAYLRQAKEKLISRLTENYFQNVNLGNLESRLKDAMSKYNEISGWLKNPDILQRITEEREKQFAELFSKSNEAAGALPNLESLERRIKYKMKRGWDGKDAAVNRFDSCFMVHVDERKKQLDSLEHVISTARAKVDSTRNNIQQKLNTIRQKVYKATNLRELEQVESQAGIEAQKKKPIEKFLANLKSIGIGRSVINYSELTAWNVSLTGFNMEYNPGVYTAVAAGKIDFGFRDFLGKNTRQLGQTFLMGRIGMGDVPRKAIIFSAFGGKKYSYGSVLNDSISNHIQVVGYSMEAIWKRDENTGISVELAKTTLPASGRFRDNDGMKNLFRFDDNSNMGINIKVQAGLEQVGTKISGFYRKTGENFQSFSPYTYNTDQTAWLLKLEQPFLKNKLNVTGILRRNDFTNPFSEKTFKTSTIFKSLQVNMRLNKWPTISAGFYPGSQLYIIDNERIQENAYYIINGSVMHNYTLSGIRMLSSVIYNRYSSKGTDSGFIAYAGVNYMASHAFILRKAQLQAAYIFTDQEQMQFYSLEASADYSLNTIIRLGAGLKHNRISGGNTYLGGRAQIAVEVGKLGGLQLQYEKSYLPTIRRTLYPVETGRLLWFKNF